MNEISIVITSWNARDYLRKCLASIRDTRGEVVREIVVVDNASSDDSAEMVTQEFPEVILLRLDRNLGFARANNLGAKQCSGEYVAFLNSDVVVHPHCLQRLLAFLETHKGVGLVGPKVFWGDGRLQRTCRFFPGVWNLTCQALCLDWALPRWRLFSGREMKHWDFSSTAEVEVLGGCFWLTSRSALEAVGPLDERFFFYGEDVDWCKRFPAAGWKVVLFPEATATHFGGGSSSTVPLRYSIEMLRANLLYWRKHYGMVGGLFYFTNSVVHNGVRVALLGLKLAAGQRNDSVTRQKFREYFVCLRWLLTRKEA